VYAVTVTLLRSNNHDVTSANEKGLSQASDTVLLQTAAQDRRILVTRDRDFGALVFVQSVHAGVIYLRIQPTTVSATHDELLRVLTQYDETDLQKSLVVVEPGRHRIRRITP
jgi:predicted nuclease of predicted toxin-antitoxin system